MSLSKVLAVGLQLVAPRMIVTLLLSVMIWLLPYISNDDHGTWGQRERERERERETEREPEDWALL